MGFRPMASMTNILQLKEYLKGESLFNLGLDGIQTHDLHYKIFFNLKNIKWVKPLKFSLWFDGIQTGYLNDKIFST